MAVGPGTVATSSGWASGVAVLPPADRRHPDFYRWVGDDVESPFDFGTRAVGSGWDRLVVLHGWDDMAIETECGHKARSMSDNA